MKCLISLSIICLFYVNERMEAVGLLFKQVKNKRILNAEDNSINVVYNEACNCFKFRFPFCALKSQVLID